MIFKENLSMYELFKETALNDPKQLALYFEKKRISYKHLLTLVEKFSYILETKLGLKRGDVITISLPNTPHALIILYAANKLGIICNMVHPFTPYNQLIVLMKKTKSKIAFLFEQRIAKEVDKYRNILNSIYVCRIEDYLPLLKKIYYHVFMNFRIRHKLGKGFKRKSFKYFYSLKGKINKTSCINNNGNGTALYLHSGSTTGEPKTIMVSNVAMNFIAAHGAEEMNLESQKLLRGQGMISFLPSFHGFGLGMTMHLPLVNRMSCVLIPKFSPKAVCSAMNHTYVSTMCGVPNAYESLVNSDMFKRNKHLNRFITCFSGGDSLPLSTQNKWKEIMKAAGSDGDLFEGYGLTETVAAVVVNTRGHHKDNSLGKPLSEVDVKIIKDDGKVANCKEIGEICIKCMSNMIGYLNDPEASKKAMIDDYVHTGDLGYIDEDGFIFFTNRKKRVIKVSGVGVFPTEIEHLVETIPGVDNVVAISIPDPRLQKAIKLIVVSKYLDKEGLSQTIMDNCRKYLIKWAVPKEIEYRDTLPLTNYNKVDYRILQEEEDKKHQSI